MDEYNKLNELFAKDQDKISIINGLLMAQAMCSRRLMEGHSEGVLDVMENISKAVEKIKNGSLV